MSSNDTTDHVEPDEECATLAEIVTDEHTNPYKREAAIKQLSTCDGGETILRDLANGAALTPPEQSLAEAKLTTTTSAQHDR
jgi:hypothetical protein